MAQNKSISIITRNEKMRNIIHKIDRVVDSNSPILLVGETGVGKEIFANYIHRTSNRNRQPLMKIGLSALPTELIESELFGHEKGAYTTAILQIKGLFEMASGGSLFLDDVPMSIQAKLLRVLESGELML